MKRKSVLFATVKKNNVGKIVEQPKVRRESIQVRKYDNCVIKPLNYYKSISQIIELK